MEPSSSQRSPGITETETASSSRKERRPREGADDGADCVARGPPAADCVFNLAALCPAYPIKRLRARREHRHPKASKTEKSPLDPLENHVRYSRSIIQSRQSASGQYPF